MWAEREARGCKAQGCGPTVKHGAAKVAVREGFGCGPPALDGVLDGALGRALDGALDGALRAAGQKGARWWGGVDNSGGFDKSYGPPPEVVYNFYQSRNSSYEHP